MKATTGVVFSCGLWIKSLNLIIQMQATKQHFPMVLDILQYNKGLPLGAVDEIPKCGRVKKRRRQYF